MSHVVLVQAKRSAIGSFLGSLKDLSAVDIATTVLDKALLEIGLDRSLVDEVIMGNVLQAGNGQNPARKLLINAKIPETKSAFTINKVCGSGLKAVALGVNSLLVGDNEVVVAGGMENMSRSPHLLFNSRIGTKMGDIAMKDSMILDGLWCAMEDYHMGITAENLAKKYDISRSNQDEFSLNSQTKAALAIKNGNFKDEIVDIEIKVKKDSKIFNVDEFVRADASLEALAKLRPAFSKEGSVTAGNASGVNDGAAVVILMKEEKAKKLGLKPLARILKCKSAGVPPSIMGIGAAFGAKAVLESLNLSTKDIDLFELNEAFAAQSLASFKELGLNKDDLKRVNINGGAVALGHPIGASGARILVTLVHALKKNNLKTGLASLCIGGGQGIACVIERCE